jgi:hypothetical protein
MRVNVWKFILPGVALGLALVGEPAYAVATLELNDNGTIVTITDNGAGDNSATVGRINWDGTVGNFTLNLDSGITKPAAGTAVQPYMDLLVQNQTSPGSTGGTLIITFTEDGFMLPNTGFQMNAGGTANVGVSGSYEAFYNDGTPHLIGSIPIVSPAFSGHVTGPGGATTPYALTQVLTINYSSGVLNFSGDFELHQTPEPATVALLGGALLVMFGALRRKIRRA